MSDIQRDREERQYVIEVLKSWDGYFIGYTSDEVQEALRYAIASIETDLRYDLLYEETIGQADKQADKTTTKNDCEHCSKTYGTLGCCDTVNNEWVYSCKEGHEEYVRGLRKFGSTTKNDLGVASGLEKNSKKLEKDFGELDCISRSDVLKLMQDNWHTHNGDWAMQESMDDIRALPAVTPQEPRKITLEDVKGYCEPRCLTIISNELLYELTHPKIKALEQESASTQEYGLTDADTDKYAVQVQNGEGYYNSFGRYVSYDLD